MKFTYALIFSILFNCAFSQTKVLFIGNSLTRWHNQADKFKNLATSTGKDVFVCDGTENGSDFVWHMNNQATLDLINQEQWDYVVLQDSRYGIAFPEYHHIIDSTVNLMASLIYNNNPSTQIVYFLDYPRSDRVIIMDKFYQYNYFQDMITMGTLIYTPAEMYIAPIGEAMRIARNDNPDFELIEEDNVHPTNYGGYLSACVYYSIIFKERCVGNSFHDTLNEEDANYLQTIASILVMNNLEQWHLVDDYDPEMTIAYAKSDVSVIGRSDGTITIGAYGGVKPYSFKLNDGEFGLSNTFSLLEPDTYNVTIMDNLDTVKVIEVTINEPSNILSTTEESDLSTIIEIYPNPVTDYLKVEPNSNLTIDYIEIYSLATGMKTEKVKSDNHEYLIDFSDKRPGTYLIKIISEEKVHCRKIIKL